MCHEQGLDQISRVREIRLGFIYPSTENSRLLSVCIIYRLGVQSSILIKKYLPCYLTARFMAFLNSMVENLLIYIIFCSKFFYVY